MKTSFILSAILAAATTVPTWAAVDCTDSTKKDACIEQLVKYSNEKDPFFKAIMVAEAARHPKSECGALQYWTLERKKSGIYATAVLTCTGPDTHVNVEFAGQLLSVNGDEWMVRITDFSERGGD